VIGHVLALLDAARDRARRRKWQPDQAAGRRGEDLAHRALEREGMTVVARNYRPPGGGGEVDLVAWDGETLVFVEVKSRSTDEFGSPERNIGEAKRAALTRAARAYARRAGAPWERVRFDIVSVLFSPKPRVEHRKDAWRAAS
jgi:putative endonuclease